MSDTVKANIDILDTSKYCVGPFIKWIRENYPTYEVYISNDVVEKDTPEVDVYIKGEEFNDSGSLKFVDLLYRHYLSSVDEDYWNSTIGQSKQCYEPLSWHEFYEAERKYSLWKDEEL